MKSNVNALPAEARHEGVHVRVNEARDDGLALERPVDFNIWAMPACEVLRRPDAENLPIPHGNCTGARARWIRGACGVIRRWAWR